MGLLPYGQIDIGEPDANAEYMQALKSKQDPVFIRSYFNLDLPNFEQFESGTKFIIIGQKGTGKTAVLRYLENRSIKQGYATEFIIFKNTILREAELFSVNDFGIANPLIDEEKIFTTKYYLHTIKRILLSVIISAVKGAISEADVSDDENKSLVSKILSGNAADSIRAAYDSIASIVNSAGVDIKKLSKGRVTFDPALYVKKSNDQLLAEIVRKCKADPVKIRIFIDELHFSYRDSDHVSSDAALVRDTIVSCLNLNERFIREGVDITMYIGVRSEFLEQPEIGYADIVQTVESYGEQINWETYPVDSKHPIFELARLRFQDTSGNIITKDQLFSAYLNGVDAVEFLKYTWCKPRDIVRYFKHCKAMYPNQITLSSREYGAVIRQYSMKAWDEVRSAISAFIPSNSMLEFEKIVKSIVPRQFDGSLKLNYEEFSKKFNSISKIVSKKNPSITHIQLMDWLYKIGLYYFEYEDSNGNIIYQQYHRGNRTPTKEGCVKIHLAIAKALG
ncbi:P-loop ATPase, Sll1717 family [Pinisolibacter sp.]|uniref:P-loop ATPase, Sll1717 family n=1 Tax=Pinisolibacter sp. TaxID=2172024 RepID=UPI002FDCDE4C